MQPSDILKKIRPCDKDEPFVFVSYSSLDAQRVWEDVLRFQQMGYNVWLDEKNLDKTKASWQDDALESIRDFNCALLVYYVSRNSLVSQACFSELECTVEDTTQAIHNGPVKFFAVDVEPIGDIIKFKNEVYGELSRKKMDKAEKTAQAITLSKCINQFFNSNNKRVRVKAYSLPNRKKDYYEEIVADFPDETRIYEPQVEKIEPKTVVKEKPTATPVETLKSAPKPPVQPEKKEAPKVLTAEDLKEFMQWSLPAEQEIVKKVPKAFSLEQAFADANQKLGKDPTNRFTVYKDITEKQMRNFRKAMGVPDSLEITGIEALWGFGDGHEAEGLLVDENKLYYGTNLCSKVEYRKVTSVEFFLSDDALLVHYEDSNIGSMIGPDTLCVPIKAFLQACVDQRT